MAWLGDTWAVTNIGKLEPCKKKSDLSILVCGTALM